MAVLHRRNGGLILKVSQPEYIRTGHTRALWCGLAAMMLCCFPTDLLAKKGPADIVILGSSSVNGGLGRRIQHELKEIGYNVIRNGKSSTGFARPDFHDWFKEIPNIVKKGAPKAVIVFAGVNDGQGLWLHKKERTKKGKSGRWIYYRDEEPWSQKYESRVRDFVEGLCANGVERVVILLPVDVIPEKLEKRLVRVRALQAAAATGSCGMAISTSGDLEIFKTNRRKKKSYRASDGVHPTGKGAEAIWGRIGEELIRSLPPAAKKATP
jgi:hypothetical protein